MKTLSVAPELRKAATRRGGRPPTGKIEERDRSLLDVAEQIFLSIGYHNVSLALVARTANVAVRTIYDRYCDKRGLLEKIIERMRQEDAVQLDRLANEYACAEELFCKLALHMFEHPLSARACLIHADALAERDFPLVAGIPCLRSGRWRQILKQGLARDIPQECRFSENDGDLLADVFLGCVLQEHNSGGDRYACAETSASAREERARVVSKKFMRILSSFELIASPRLA